MRNAWYFLFCSFGGFVLEVLYAHMTGAAEKGRKCMLFGPLCPVYGLGALGMLSLPAWIQASAPLFAACCALTACGAEYAMSWFYERCWGIRFWDYSKLPLQINGRICLSFGVVWGLLGLPLRDVILPAADTLYSMMPEGITAALFAAFWADLICTALVLSRRREKGALRWWVKESGASQDPVGSAPA